MYFCIVFPNCLILLRELVGLQKGEDYKRLFNAILVPSIRLNLGIAANYAQDNYSIHICNTLRQCYATSDIKIIDWP